MIGCWIRCPCCQEMDMRVKEIPNPPELICPGCSQTFWLTTSLILDLSWGNDEEAIKALARRGLAR